MNVANFDVASLSDHYVAFTKEIVKSQSARQAEFTENDRNRAMSYLDRIQTQADLIADTKLDLPSSHPETYPVAAYPPDEDINSIENSIVKAVLRRFKAGYTELVRSQSKDSASGLHVADKRRLDELIAATKELVNFGENTLDLPENTGTGVAGNGS